MEITITYAKPEGETTFEPAFWEFVRADGVQSVAIKHDRYTVNIAGKSLYWLYWDNGKIVVGSGSVKYDPNPITEILIDARTFEQVTRQLDGMPDLHHSQVKLGWWNGEDVLP